MNYIVQSGSTGSTGPTGSGTANYVAVWSAASVLTGYIGLQYDGSVLKLGNPTATGRVFDFKQDTAFGAWGSYVGGTNYVGFYVNQATPSASNYTLIANGTSTTLAALGSAGVLYFVADSAVSMYATLSRYGVYIGGASTAVSRLHIAAGTTSARTGAIQIAAGTLETTPREGVMEYNNDWYITKKNIARLGMGGTFACSPQDQSNGAGSGDTAMWPVTFGGGTLHEDGDMLYFTACGISAANANLKGFKVKFGATTIFDSGTAIGTADWIIEGWIMRSGSATQRTFVRLTGAAAGMTAYDYNTAAETMSIAISLQICSIGVDAGDITGKFMNVRYFPKGDYAFS